MQYIDSENFFEANMIKDYNSKKMKRITNGEIAFLKKIFKNKNAKILDIMCGYGRLANVLYECGFHNIDGVDMDEYNFIAEDKKFRFIQGDFYDMEITEKYDYCYSLYNSYPNIDKFLETINKCETIIKENGYFIIDIFSKEWRDTLPSVTKRKLLENEKVLVSLDRFYDGEYEKTKYKIYDKTTNVSKEYDYCQAVVSKEKLCDLVPIEWDFSILNSKEQKTREDNQKHILVLKRR